MKLMLGVVAVASSLLVGCGGLQVKKPASPEQQAALLGNVKRMAGEWEMKDPNGTWVPACAFKVTSNGSVVREVMFAGAAHEMTNMYHMDGDSIVMTHYCSMGNQPRMRATKAEKLADGSVAIPFEYDSVSNLAKQDDGYMGKMTLIIKDDKHAEERWQHMKEGKVEGGATEFVLRRKS